MIELDTARMSIKFWLDIMASFMGSVMGQPTWSVQDAKNHFSEVVEEARRGGPQTVTKHGKPAVVVLSANEYERLRTLERLEAPSFADHLLAMPSDDGSFDRLEASLRDTGF